MNHNETCGVCHVAGPCPHNSLGTVMLTPLDDAETTEAMLRALLASERAAHKATREERDRIRVSEQAAHASAEEAETQLAAAVEVVRLIGPDYDFSRGRYCRYCGEDWDKHAPDCALAAVLGAGRGTGEAPRSLVMPP